MFDIFKKDKSDHKKDDNLYINIGALLIHVAKIDENYSEKEKNIIKKTLLELGLSNQDLDNVFKKSEEIEKNSNQLLNYTNIIKKNSMNIKKDIIEHLWKVIISDNTIDQYESNLVRRVCGLIYFPDKESAEIKLRLINSK